MEDFNEGGPSLPDDILRSCTKRRKSLLDALPSTPPIMHKKSCGKVVLVHNNKTLNVPICVCSIPQWDIYKHRPELKRADKIIFYPESNNSETKNSKYDFMELSDKMTGNIKGITKSQAACKLSDLGRAVSTKSTLVYFPVDVKLTDKHLAQMTTTPQDVNQIIFPNRMQFDETLGSFLCIVERIDKYNYEFKVMIIPGKFTEEPDTLSKLMQLFNPLYYTKCGFNNETINKKAKIMMASATNEFFGPQIVESYIAVWLSCHRDPYVVIKKSNMVTKVTNLKSELPSIMAKKKVPIYPTLTEKAKRERTNKNAAAANRPTSRGTRAATPLDTGHVTFTSPKSLKASARNAHYLTAIFGYNSALYPSVHTGYSKHGLFPMYDFIKETQVDEAELSALLADLCPLNTLMDETRAMG